MKEEIYDVGGMHCAACSASVERVVKKLPGIENADVNLMFGTLNVVYDEKSVSSAQIIAKVEKAGFTAALRTADGGLKTKANYTLRQVIICIALSFLLMAVSMFFMYSDGNFLPEAIRPSVNPFFLGVFELLLVIPTVIIGRRYYTDGLSSLIKLRPDMNSLVAVSSLASLVYSIAVTALNAFGKATDLPLFYESASMVIALVSLGKFLENSAKNKTKDALEKLISLSPETALKVEKNDDGSFTEPTEVRADSLYTEDIILVRRGERVPADAVVISGHGSADESALTGESLPVAKAEGDRIVCGSLLSDGFVYASVTSVGSGTVIAGIVRFVSEAQRKKAPISRLADRVAGVFVPAVMAISLAAGALWLILGKDISFAVRIFTSVLVIACPCAMGLATPTAIMSGTGLGAAHGILVRSGEALEKLAHTQVAVFDKTGTLTLNTPKVEYIETLQDTDAYSEGELLECFVSLEKYSLHPYAAAIISEGEKRGIVPAEISDYTDMPGLGIAGTLADGRKLIAGSYKAVKEASGLPEDLPGAVYLTVNGAYAGRIIMSDPVRPEAADTVKALKNMGIDVKLLSGDSRENAEKIGKKLGIDGIYSGVLPEEKAGYVEKFREGGKTVAMIGDGINDAPALTVADIGIAVGNGTDIAIDAADVVLMQSGIASVVPAVKLGKLTIRNIKQNLFWAFCYNVLAIPLACGALYPAFGILLTPMIGGICMSFSSLFVVTNALRLGRKQL